MIETTLQAIDLGPNTVLTTNQQAYTIQKELGQGGFGSVYHVHSQQGEFALKLTKMWQFPPTERIEYAKRFKQEYEYAKSIPGDNIVKSYDYHVHLGNPFIIMDYCGNGSLRQYIGRTLPKTELVQMAAGILQGLGSMHGEGIIHRDLKPENILFGKNNTPKLADFGISASIRNRMTRRNMLGHVKEVFASGVYSPPEQLDPSKAYNVMGNTNDIYAFGALMYELITEGAMPFGSFEEFQADIRGYEDKKKKGNWNRALLAKKGNDPVWETIIEKCLQYKPEDRYQQVHEIIALLPKEAATRPTHIITNAPSFITNWQLKVMNGEEIGRTYYLSNLSRFAEPTWINHAALSEWLNTYKPSEVKWQATTLKMLTIGWFNEEEPFANSMGIAEHFTHYISRHHASLLVDNSTNQWYIADGQPVHSPHAMVLPVKWKPSTNGTLVNSKPLTNALQPLYLNDIITIGDTTFKVIGE